MNAHIRNRTLVIIYSLLAMGAKSAIGATPPCESCHGAHGEGAAAAHVPRIAGQSVGYLRKQLEDFASGARESAIMANFARALTSEERAKFAARFAAMTGTSVAMATPVADSLVLARGHRLAHQGDETKHVQSCNACHGPEGTGVVHAAPYLAGQSADYLATELKAFHDRTRKNDAGEVMRSVAAGLNEADIAALSDYFASVHVDPPGTGSVQK